MTTPVLSELYAAHSRCADPRIHRDGRTGGFRGADASRRPGCVVRHDSQRPRSARGHGLRVAAAHLGRTCADRPRLPVLRGSAARSASARPRMSSGVEARLRQQAGEAPIIDDLLSSASHVLSEASRARRLRDRARQRRRGLPAHRVRAPRRHPDSGRRGDARQPGLAEDHRHRRTGRLHGARHRRRTTSIWSSPAEPLDDGARGRARRGSARSGRCTINCSGSRCASPADRSTTWSVPLGLHRRHLVAPRRSRARERAVDADAARARCGWSKRSSAWCGCSTNTSTDRALTVVIGAEHNRPGAAAVQSHRVDLLRRAQHRTGRRHRADAHALLARHRCRRGRGAAVGNVLRDS